MDLIMDKIGDRQVFLRPDSGDEPVLADVKADAYDLRVIERTWERDDPIVFDIGAHIGLFSVWIKEVWPKATIYAFEASPENIPLLEQNLDGYDNVTIVPKAVVGWDNETVRFVPHTSLPVDGKTGHGQICGPAFPDAINVPATSLAPYVERYRDINIFKIDVEGAEGQIFQDLRRQHLTANIGWIRGEWHHVDMIRPLYESLQPTHQGVFKHHDHGRGKFAAHRITTEYWD